MNGILDFFFSATAQFLSDHVPLALFVEDPHQFEAIVHFLTSQGFYENRSLFVPGNPGSPCSIHSPFSSRNPTQFILGFTDEKVTVAGDQFFVRLPDKMTAIHLALAQDLWGLNPAWILGLAAASSHLTLVPANSSAVAPGPLIAEYENFQCYGIAADAPYCGNYKPIDPALGPMQETLGALALDLSAMPGILLGWTTDPVFASRHWFQDHHTELGAYHSSLVAREAWRAIALGAVHANVLHTVVSLLPGLRWSPGTSEIEAAAVLANWEAKLGDQWRTDALGVCEALDSAPASYDLVLYREDIEEFIRQLKESLFGRNASGIDWSALAADAMGAFGALGRRRASLNRSVDSQGRDEFISMRFDLRTLLAIIRGHLPPRQPLVGFSTGGLHKLHGPTLGEPFPDSSPSTFPSPWCSTAGGSENLCSDQSVSPPGDTESNATLNGTDSPNSAAAVGPFWALI